MAFGPRDMLRYSPIIGSTRTETFGAGTSSGTTLTASGTANTKGTYVSLGTTTFEWNHVSISLAASSASADHLVDIAIDDGGGNKWIILPDLRHPSRISANASPVLLSLPLYVPKGSLIYARSSSSTASATMAITISGLAIGRGGAPGYSRCVALYTPGTSRGTSVDPGAVAGTTSAWVQLTTGASVRVAEWFAVVGTGGNTSRTTSTWLVDFAIGASGSEQVVLADVLISAGVSTTAQGPFAIGPYPTDVPASTAWSVRAVCSQTSATGRILDFCLYGFVG
jgi:hypothetical protein